MIPQYPIDMLVTRVFQFCQWKYRCFWMLPSDQQGLCYFVVWSLPEATKQAWPAIVRVEVAMCVQKSREFVIFRNENITSSCISVRRWRSFQGGAERVPHSGARWGWLLRRGSARHAYAVGDHHYGYQDTERSRREGPQDPRADLRGPEAVQHPGAVRGAVRWESSHSWSLRHRAGWILEIQTHWRLVSC